jgi:hypothetical protein
MTNKELDLTENATNASVTEEILSTTVENSTENVESKTIEETAKDYMNEQKDTIENVTENSVEETVNTTENTTQETLYATKEAVSNIVAEVESVASEIMEVVEITIEETPIAVESAAVVESIAVIHNEEIVAAIEPIEEEAHEIVAQEMDYSSFTKKDFVDLGEKLLASIKAEGVSVSDVKNADVVMREIKPIFDDLKAREKADALKKYIADNGNNEGFEYKNDNFVVRFESLNAQIRDAKNGFFQKIERLKEDYFERKTKLLQRLREVVDEEEKSGSKSNWQEFKKIQEDWKNAGNVNSPHNTTFWSAYNALVDRYFSIRHIQNELKDLDRKKKISLQKPKL